MTERFNGKVAGVTGAGGGAGGGGGVGAAWARRRAAEGASVAAFDRDGAAAAAVAKEVGGEPFEVDIRGSAAVAAAVEAVTARFGGLDVLVNVAGVVRYGE